MRLLRLTGNKVMSELVKEVKKLLSICEVVAEDYSIGIENMEYEDEAEESRHLHTELIARMGAVAALVGGE